ncbi:MAG: glucose 1-dehydrogenase [Prolixibacteraceae bacterium]
MIKRTVIITGAGQGIGKAIALAFASKKYHVVIADINPVSGKQVMDEICEMGESAIFMKTDVTKISEIESTIDETYKKYGHINVLINNAGISEFHDPFELDEENWDKVMNTNLKSVFFASRKVAFYMKSKGGAIINIASTRALMSEPNSEAYAATKGGVLALTHALAASFSAYKIMVNAILPGWIENGDYSALRPEDHQQHFSQRVGKPEDIARACLFLADKENTFITGAHLVIDGGMTRKMIYEE